MLVPTSSMKVLLSQKNGNSDENATPVATLIVFGDDETIAEFLVSISQNKAKQKGVEIKDAEDSDRPRPTSTTTHKDQDFDDLDDFDAMDYMETEDAYNEKGVSTEDQVSTVKPDEGTDKPKVSTDKIDEGTAELKNGNSDENATLDTPTATPTVFRDDETIAEFLVSMSQNKAKQKGVEIKDAEDSERPRPTSTRSLLTLKPLPKIDPKAKGKGMIEEEDESDTKLRMLRILRNQGLR
ncbi:hypothetical protein Tco_0147748 [Tanacetum coccineum]